MIGAALVGVYVGAMIGGFSMEWWSQLGDALSPVVAVVGVLLLIRQIRSSEHAVLDAQAAEREQRISDTLRLVTEWLESPQARQQRENVFRTNFILENVAGGSQPWNAFKRNIDLSHPNTQRLVEDVVAQFDRVGAYLKRVPAPAREAVLDIYANSIARCWLVLGPWIIMIRTGRGESYGQHFADLATVVLDRFEKGKLSISLHPFGEPTKSLTASLEEARAPLEQARRAKEIVAHLSAASAAGQKAGAT